MQMFILRLWNEQGQSKAGKSGTGRRASSTLRRHQMTSVIRFLVFTLLTTLGFAQNPKIAPGMETLDQNSMVDVIVRYNHVATEANHQRVLAQGGALRRQLDVINGSHYTIPVRALGNLAEDSDVVHISPNHKLKASQVSQAPVDVAENAVNANIAFSYGWDGTGIGVAVIDRASPVIPT